MLRALLLLFSVLPAWALAGPSVTDALGRTVTLPQPATRIVALAPHIVENLYSAGAGDRVVAVVSHSDYPAAARSLPQVGSAFSWSLESVVALAPDLVVLWGSGNGMSALAQLERLGLVVYVSEPRSLADIGDSIRDFGELAGTSATAQREALAFESSIAALRRQAATGPQLSVFYQIWNSPLQTVNGEHLISRVIELCGGRNIFADTPQIAPRVALESVLAADPDAIIASGMGQSRPEWLDDWLQYPSLRAVKGDALLHVHPDLIQRPTVRIAQGATHLCAKLDRVRQREQGR
ncbi:cobalamin-binding protein [Pseudohalioglobus sediminis]|uniref:Cobalamin-binding protein n=1 Tax=Pseudohalioglobus sediminis TaxID=2606449 RepID=A0A5B0X6J8_9GAMM|nr:cobalamin-binding protein [Pseudohalioglobus sediminis]KAA1194137.1 cobalamin-binding protein [Pseudohalioglobus sediminis]